MESLYSGMSVGFGFLLFCALLSFICILFKNFKKLMFPQGKSIDVIDLAGYQVEERREEKRVEIIWPVSIKTNNEIIQAETKELSRSGAFVKCSKPLSLGERFFLFIETPGKVSIYLKAEVVWSNSNIPEEKVVTRGMGIRFIRNNDENAELLKSSLENYLIIKKIIPDRKPVQRALFT